MGKYNYKDVTGVWKGKYAYGFKVTQEFKDTVADLPEDVYINLLTNKYYEEGTKKPQRKLVALLPKDDDPFDTIIEDGWDDEDDIPF